MVKLSHEGFALWIRLSNHVRTHRECLVDNVATLTRWLGGTITIALNALLEYYDTLERLVIRDCSLGRLGRDLILQGDLDLV